MAFFGRGKNRIQQPYTYKDMYKDYQSEMVVGDNYEVSLNTYGEIIKLFFKKVSTLLLEDSDWFRLMHNIGTFQIVKKHSYARYQGKTVESIDWYSTLKYGKRIVHLNEHSDHKKYLFFWDKRTSNITNVGSYRFIPTRTHKRQLAYNIKTLKRDYFEYDSQKHK